MRAPPARTRAGCPRTRRKPQVRAPSQRRVGWQAPAYHLRFRHQDAQNPPSPSLGEGGRGDEGAHAHRNARASLPGTLPLMRCARLRRARGRDARAPGANLRCARPRRGGLVGKPRRSFSCFGLRDTQNPPSPRVGEGGRGDEGAHAHGNSRASLPGTLPLRGARASGAHTGGTPAPPTRRKPQVRAPSQGRVGWQAPAYHLPFQASGRPTSPFSQFGRREQGGMRGHTRTGMPAHLSQERSP